MNDYNLFEKLESQSETEQHQLLESLTLEDDIESCLKKECQIKDPHDLLYISTAALNTFARLNFTQLTNLSQSQETVLSKLELERPLFPLTVRPELLLVAKIIFENYDVSAINNPPLYLAWQWWHFRYLRLHQLALPTYDSHFLWKAAAPLAAELMSRAPSHSPLRDIFLLEIAHFYIQYHEVTQARNIISELCKLRKLDISFEGALGTRTLYQKTALPQLFLALDRYKDVDVSKMTQDPKDEASTSNDAASGADLPIDVKVENGESLNRLKLVEEKNILKISPLDQALVLATCMLHWKLAESSDVKREELMTFIDYLLQQPLVWTVHTKVLLLRCKLDRLKPKRYERSLKQLEELTINLSKADHESSRMQLFYCTQPLPSWVIEKEKADMLVRLRNFEEAALIYEKLELWEEVIQSFKMAGQRAHAEAAIRARIEKNGPTPRLLCHLAEVTSEPNLYKQAWDLSNHTSTQSQNGLGFHLYFRNMFEDCLPFFMTSLELNPHQPDVWYAVGVSADTVGDYHLAARAFLRYCEFNPDSAEAWNNLGKAYIYTKEKKMAWKAFKESLRCNYDDWRIWENFVILSIDVGAFNDVINAWHRLLDLKNKYMDEEVLKILVKAVVEDIEDINQNKASKLHSKLLTLMGRISSKTSSPVFWQMYALLYKTGPDKDAKESQTKVLHYLRKAHDSLKSKEFWYKEVELVAQVSHNLNDLEKVTLKFAQDFPSEHTLPNEIRLTKDIISKTIDFLSQKPCKRLPQSQQRVDEIISSLKESLEKLESVGNIAT